jgi:hypothetical protein
MKEDENEETRMKDVSDALNVSLPITSCTLLPTVGKMKKKRGKKRKVLFLCS